MAAGKLLTSRDYKKITNKLQGHSHKLQGQNLTNLKDTCLKTSGTKS